MTMTTENLCELMRIAVRSSDKIDGAVNTFRALVQEQYALAERALEPQGQAHANPYRATFPQRVWLNVGDCNETELAEFSSHHEITWADSQIDQFDIEYVRADLAFQLALPAGTFQQRVQPWMMACFGEMISNDLQERNHRFLEEALELVQSTGCTQSEAHQLVDYVFGRPVGEPVQEVGGVMVTLAALCLAAKMDMHAAGETELARIWTKVDQIRAKQAAKPKHSPLPMALPAGPVPAWREISPDDWNGSDWKYAGAGDTVVSWGDGGKLYAFDMPLIGSPAAAQPVADERYCLFCEKPGHQTIQCGSTHGLNTPRARELAKLAARAALGQPAEEGGNVE